jgi:bifunctional DNA-binding transcriptional regulator/antitoxin component of YhaV-PrlF toxin-antitoxin module
MTTTVKIQPRGKVTLPLELWNQVGLASGGLLEARARRGSIVLTPKSKVSDEDYTPAQRRFIDRKLAEGLEDIRSGRVHGPFATSDEMMASMEAEVRKIRAARKIKRRR